MRSCGRIEVTIRRITWRGISYTLRNPATNITCPLRGNLRGLGGEKSSRRTIQQENED